MCPRARWSGRLKAAPHEEAGLKTGSYVLTREATAGARGHICRSPACSYIEVAPAKADCASGPRTRNERSTRTGL